MDDAYSAVATQSCTVCGSVGFTDGDDGFFYCGSCGSQAVDIVDTGVNDEDMAHAKGAKGGDAIYTVINTRPVHKPPSTNTNTISQVSESLSFYQSLSKQFSEPIDFAVTNADPSLEKYYNNVRISYVCGLQLMINYQCEALVQKFNVSPLICGIAGTIWLRYVRSTRAFEDGWADEVRLDSQLESQGGSKMRGTKSGGKLEPRNTNNQRMVVLWYRSLRKLIPLSSSLAIIYLACHIAREPVLPTDIQKWTLEGTLPYLVAFVEIGKKIPPTKECPFSASYMFRPAQAVRPQKLESIAANIAQSVCLVLPPVNFNGIAARYIKNLSLPVEKILPYAREMHDWSMPPDLWMSTCELRLPTRVCVMAIVIIAVRILYNLNGFGKWEASLSDDIGSTRVNKSAGGLNSQSMSETEDNTEAPEASDEETTDLLEVHKLEHEAASLLRELQKRCSITQTLDYSKDLETYLQYCKDVVFGGLEPSTEDFAEHKMIKRFWGFYADREKDSEGQEEDDEIDTRPRKCSSRRYEEESVHSLDYIGAESPSSQGPGNSASSSLLLLTASDADAGEPSTNNCELPSDDLPSIAIRLMKLHMEENRFCYIPPRNKVKRLDYLHYIRKRDDGSLAYVAHADYYILLHACAKEAEVDIRIMHQGVLSLERRLAWIENRVDMCMHSSST